MKPTPQNASRKALAKISNPLPVPTVCPNCGAKVRVTNNKEIYGEPVGIWPWIYRCVNSSCDSYVGLHPYTHIPIGTLADKKTRAARCDTKLLFNALWQDGGMSRSAAYAWLAEKMGIDKANCHIGWFNSYYCRKASAICKEEYLRRKDIQFLIRKAA